MRGGALAVAADERRHAEQQHQRAGGVGLAPERRVVPGHRVEDVERGRHAAPGVSARRPGQAQPSTSR